MSNRDYVDSADKILILRDHAEPFQSAILFTFAGTTFTFAVTTFTFEGSTLNFTFEGTTVTFAGTIFTFVGTIFPHPIPRAMGHADSECWSSAGYAGRCPRIYDRVSG